MKIKFEKEDVEIELFPSGPYELVNEDLSLVYDLNKRELSTVVRLSVGGVTVVIKKSEYRIVKYFTMAETEYEKAKAIILSDIAENSNFIVVSHKRLTAVQIKNLKKLVEGKGYILKTHDTVYHCDIFILKENVPAQNLGVGRCGKIQRAY